jgi:hypothetical protein
VSPPRYIKHITLDTGHTRRSPRDEVDDQAVAALQDGITLMLSGGRPQIPGMDGYAMTGTAQGRCLIATAWGPSGTPLVTIGVATRSLCGAPLWRILHDPAGRIAAQTPLASNGQRCPEEPWCAARLEIGLAVDHDAAHWLGDWERCLAWAWLSRLETRHVD